MESSNTNVVDSSVFVALYRPGDTHHEKAKELFASLEQQTLVVHPFVIQEVATVLCYTDGVARAKAFLSDIQNANNIRITMPQVSREIQFFTKLSKKLSFTDSTLILLAQDTGAQLLSFDTQMMKIAQKVARDATSGGGAQ